MKPQIRKSIVCLSAILAGSTGCQPTLDQGILPGNPQASTTPPTTTKKWTIAAWLRPTAITQSVTPLRTQIEQEVDAQLATKGLTKTSNEQAVQEIVNSTGPTRHFNIQVQTACEAEMLDEIDAREVFSGKAYEVLTEIAPEYGRAIPHIYVFPGSWNMAYIAGSAAVDVRGKILVGQQAIELFNIIALRGFLGHEMAHLVSDNGAQGCNDYIIRDPQVEADADAFAARVLGMQPVKAFLERVLALKDGRNSDAKGRLELLQ
jgi:Zn-dependent protease with chaperone function